VVEVSDPTAGDFAEWRRRVLQAMHTPGEHPPTIDLEEWDAAADAEWARLREES
jgi:hypothetical protein